MFQKKILGVPVFAAVAAVCMLAAAALCFSTIRATDRAPRPASTSGHAAAPAAETAEQLRGRITTAGAGDYPDLMRAILGMKDARVRDELASELMLRWLESDIDSLAAFFDDAEVEGDDILARLAPVLVALAGHDVAEAFEFRDLLARVIAWSAGSDPRQALVWARQCLDGSPLDGVLATIATELVHVDADAAVAVVDEIEAMANRVEAADGIGRVLGADQPGEALEWAESFIHETEQAFALSGVLTGIASRDGSTAAGLYADVVAGMKERYRLRVEADRSLAGATPEEEYEGLSPEEILKAELAKPDPNLIYLEKAAYAIGIALVREDAFRAVEWAAALDADQGRAAAMEAVFTEWAGIAPAAAFESFVSVNGRPPELAEKFFDAWASEDPEAASSAALSLAPGLERDHAVEGVARGWVDSGAGPAQVARWAEKLGSASERDRLFAVVASEGAYGDPLLAWKMLQRMRDVPKRAELFGEVFPGLLKANPAAARAALESGMVSGVERDYYATMIE